MKEHPIKVEEASAFLAFSHISTSMIAILVAIILGGGTALAAENALPGDVLFPVKVHLNEEIRAVLTLDMETAAEYELHRVRRRVDEGARVEAEGRFNANVQARLEEEIIAHTQRTYALATKLEQRGNTRAAAAVRSRLNTYLSTKSAVLANMGISILGQEQNEPPQVRKKDWNEN